MKRTKQRLGVYTVLLFLLTVAAVSIKTVALIYDFDFNTGYFENKLFSSISDALLIVGVLLSLSYATAKWGESLRASFSSPAFYLPSGLVGVALLFMSGECFKSVFVRIAANPDLGFKVFTPELILELVLALLALISIGYFLLGTLIEGRRDSTRAILGIVTALFLSFYAAYLYFDTTAPINAPIKVLGEMAYVFTSVFFLYETRISLGRDKWSLYLAFGMASSILLAASSIPALVVYFTNGAVITRSITESTLSAALFVFTSLRVLHTFLLRKDRKSPIAGISEITSEKKEIVSDTALKDFDDGEPDNYTMTFDEGEAK